MPDYGNSAGQGLQARKISMLSVLPVYGIRIASGFQDPQARQQILSGWPAGLLSLQFCFRGLCRGGHKEGLEISGGP